MVAVPYANIVVPIGRNFLAVAPASPTVVEVVSPSVNTTGVIIRTAYMVNADLYADLTPPSGEGDLTKRVIFNANADQVSLPFPLYIPPGMGVWYAAGSGSGINITWDFVNADFSAAIS